MKSQWELVDAIVDFDELDTSAYICVKLDRD